MIAEKTKKETKDEKRIPFKNSSGSCFFTYRKQHSKVNPTLSLVVASDPCNYIAQLTPKQLAILNRLLEAKNKFRHVYISQARISADLNIHRNTVNKAIRKFFRNGLIGKISRYNKSCNYYFNQMFIDDPIKVKLARYLPALRTIAASLLLSLYGSAAAHKPYVQGYFGRNVHDKLRKYKYIQKHPKVIGNSFSYLSPPGRQIRDFILKGGREMKRKFPAHVYSVKSLSLSPLGKAKIAAFPKEIVERMDRKIPFIPGVQSPFEYFCKGCIVDCRKQNIAPDWGYSQGLIIDHKLDLDGNPLTSSKINSYWKDRKAHKGKEQRQTGGHYFSATDIKERVLQQIKHVKRKERENSTIKTSGAKNTQPLDQSDKYWVEWKNSSIGQCYVHLEEINPIYEGMALQKFLRSEMGDQYIKNSNPFMQKIIKGMFDSSFVDVEINSNKQEN